MINQHFQALNQTGEQQLYDDLTVEVIQAMGTDVNYIKRDSVDEDYLFHEDPTNTFTTEITIEAYLSSVDGFGGDADFISSFGIEIKDTATFILSKTRCVEVLGGRPMEGDLIRFPLSNSIFEIKSVRHENPFYQAGKLYAYEITVELFEYSQENVTTGNTDIDNIFTNISIDDVDLSNDVYADNDQIETEADAITDWSEGNPFGTV